MILCLLDVINIKVFYTFLSMNKGVQGEDFHSYFPTLTKKQISSLCISLNPDPHIESSRSALSSNYKHRLNCLEERSLCV